MFAQSNIRVSRRWFSYLPIASSILVLLALAFVPELLPSPSFADEPITVNPSITIGNSGVLSLDVNPGQFGSSTESVVVTTSNYTGYSMTIAPSSGNNTDLEHTNVANTVIPSIPESLTQSAFSSLNSVAYGLSIDGGANYLPVVSGSTIKTTSSATNATTGAFNLTLGAKTLSNTPAGSYTKTFLLTAATNAPVYAITYNANVDGQGGSGTGEVTNLPSPNPQITGASGLNLTLSATIPERSGCEFVEWNTEADGTGDSYDPEDTYTLDPEAGNVATLYAVWEKLYLQDWDGCDSIGIGKENSIILYDRRDQQPYTVTRLNMDNNMTACWMSNLNLGAETLTVPELNSTNSDMSSATPIDKTTFESWIVSSGSASFTDPELMPLTASNTSNGLAEDSYGNKYGTAYNYAAATANTINAPMEQNTSDATNSLCPYGWRLPISLGSSEFTQLLVGNGGLSTDMDDSTSPTGAEMSVIAQRDLGFALAGRFYTSTPVSQGVTGIYVGSSRTRRHPDGTRQDNSYMFGIRVESNAVRSSEGTRRWGLPIRCIKRRQLRTITLELDAGVSNVLIDGVSYEDGDTASLEEGTSHYIEIIYNYGYAFDSWSSTSGTLAAANPYNDPATYTAGSSDATISIDTKDITSLSLQNWNGCSTLTIGDSITLYDSRDSQPYKVYKYKMNSAGTETACWMSNLNLGAKTLVVPELNSSNSNMSTAPAISKATLESWKIEWNDYGSFENPQLSVRLGTDSYGNNYGTRYNFAAASANSISAPSGANTSNANNSLCPSGWRLPTGGSSGEFSQLVTSYGGLATSMSDSTTPTAAEIVPVLQGTLNFADARGYISTPTEIRLFGSNVYWSSTINEDYPDSMHTLTFNPGSSTRYASAIGSYQRTAVISMRCIKRDFRLTIATGTGVDSVTIDGTTYHNGDTVNLAEGSTHTINMTFQTGYDFDSWSISGTGSSVASTSTNPTTLTMGTASATLTATANGYLQGWNGCDNMSVGDTVTLYDRRDNQAYTVSKYSMGNNTAACWMSNLNLGAETLAVAELNNTNSNMPTATPISKTTFESWIVSTGTASYTNPELIPLTAANTSNGLGEDSYGNKYGTSYNYAAATANTINAPINENTSDATNSLCPSGWRLPSGYGSSEFMQLMIGNGGLSTEMNSTTTPTGAEMSVIAQRDLGFSFAGRFYTSTPASQGTYGRYWSSSRSTNEPLGQPQKYSYMVTLRVDATYVRPGIDTTRLNGASIRCIKQRPMHTITLSLDSGVDSLIIDGVSYENGDTVTLEEGTSHEVDIDFVYGYGFDSWSATSGTIMTPSSYPSAYTVGASNATFTVATKDITGSFLQTWNGCSSLATDSSITLYDSRDSQAYTVSKYKMNSNGTATACWMSNLNLGAEPLTVSTLNSTNSNMPTASAISESTFKSWEIPKNTYGSYEDAQYNVRNGVDSYGNRYAIRYNYAAISANTINAAEEANNSDATNSLCPYGWRLPTGGSSGELAQLMTGYGGLTTTMNSSTTPTSASMFSTLTSTLGFPDSLGFISDSSSISYLANSAYWASTRVNGSSMYHLGMSTSYVGPDSSSARRTWVISARCIKQ